MHLIWFAIITMVIAFVARIAHAENDADLAWIGLPEDYQTKTALQKAELLQEKFFGSVYLNDSITMNNNNRPTWSNISYMQLFKDQLKQTLLPAFTCNPKNSDVLSTGRLRVMHPLGVVGLVQLDMMPSENAPSNGSKFTGLLAPGSSAIGVVRLSLAINPVFVGFTPAMALKLLINGRPSVNVVSTYAMFGQGNDFNFFNNFLRTSMPIIAEQERDPGAVKTFLRTNVTLATIATALPLLNFFKEVEPRPMSLTVRELAQFTSTGQSVSDAKYPFMLKFVPHERLTNAISSDSNKDFRDDLLDKVTPGPLYYVYAADAVDDPNATKIGLLTLTTNLVASDFGDARLCFRHQHRKPAVDEL